MNACSQRCIVPLGPEKKKEPCFDLSWHRQSCSGETDLTGPSERVWSQGEMEAAVSFPGFQDALSRLISSCGFSLKACLWFLFATGMKSKLLHRPCQTSAYSQLTPSVPPLSYDFFKFLNTLMLSLVSKSEPLQFLLLQTHILPTHDSLPL